MKNCVNRSSKEFIELSNQISINPIVLAAKVSLWQETNGLDKFPTVEDITIQEYNLNKPNFEKVTLDNTDMIFDTLSDTTTVKDNKEVSDEILFAGTNKKLYSASEILMNIINSNEIDKTENGSFFLEKAFNLLNKSGAKVRVISEEEFKDISEDGIMLYDSVDNTIYISRDILSKYSPETVLESFIHEVVHSTTVRAYFEPKTFEEREFKKFIDDAYIQYKDLSKSRNQLGELMYGFTNQAEFIAEIYSNPSFRNELQKSESFWKELIDAIRRLFGMNKTSSNNRLIESVLLFETVEKFAESDSSNWKGTIFNNPKYNIFEKQIDNKKTSLTSLEDKLNYNISRLLESIEFNVNTYRYLTRIIKDGTKAEGLDRQVQKLVSLQAEINQLSDNEKILGVVAFVNMMNDSMKYVQGQIDKVDYSDYESIKNTARIYDNYLTTYSVIEDVQQLLADISTDENQSIISKTELSELESLVAQSSGQYNLLTDKINSLKIKALKLYLKDIKYFPNVEKRNVERLRKEFKDNKIPGDRESWVIDKLHNRDKDIIQDELEQEIDNIINNPSVDIYAADVTFSTSVNISAPLINIANQILNQVNNERLDIERSEDIKFRELFNELVKEKGTNSVDKLYKNILQYDKSGKPYLLGEYNINFYTEVYNKVKELQRSKKNLLQEYRPELNDARAKFGENSREYQLVESRLKSDRIKIDAQIKKLQKDNLLFEGKKVIGIQDKWKNNITLTETESKVRQFFIDKTEESSKATFGKASLVKYAYTKDIKFYELPKITKTDTERLWSGDIKGTVSDKWKDLTTIKPDDYGYVTEEKDLSNNPINRLRVHYRGKIDNKDQSLDLFNIYRLEFKNGNMYKFRREVETELNFLVDIAKDKKYYENKGTKPVVNIRTKKYNIIEGQQSNTYKMMSNMLETKLYDVLNKTGTKIAGVELNKAVGALNATTSFLTLSLNLASGTANVLNAQSQIFLESFIKGHFITAKGIAKANEIYGKDLINILADTTNPISTSFTNQVMEMFNVHGDINFSESNFIKSDLLKKGLNRESLQIFQQSGEHWIQSTITMSVLDGIKVLNKDGKFIDKKGNEVSEVKAASLLDMMNTTEDGLVQLDDKVVYTTHSRLSEWNNGGKDKVDQLIIKKLNDSVGNYRQTDQPEIKRHWWGKLIMLYRNYLVPMGQARFRGVEFAFTSSEKLTDEQRRFSYALQENEEGTYVTLMRYLSSSIKNGEKWLLFKENWSNLSDYEKHNIKRTVTEIVLTSVLAPLAALLAGGADDDEDYKFFIAYQMRRLDTELSSYRSPGEMFKMMRSPIPSARLLETSMSTLNSTINPFSWSEINDEYEQGVNKGKNKLLVKWQKQLPVLKEFVRTYEDLYKYQNSPVGTGL